MTPFRFVPRNTALHTNYVNFTTGVGCSSCIGMRGGKQDITIESTCSRGNAIHEIGHAIGFFHEHSANNRDSFVTILDANIKAGKASNFDTVPKNDGCNSGTNHDGELIDNRYDFLSIMHYGFDSFGIPVSGGKKQTIRVIKSNGYSDDDIGQRERLSYLDRIGANIAAGEDPPSVAWLASALAIIH